MTQAIPFCAARLRSSRWMAFTACGLMILSAYLFRPDNTGSGITLAFVLAILGGLVLGAALRGVKDDAVDRTIPDSPLQTIPAAEKPHCMTRPYTLVGIGLALLWLAAEASGNLLGAPLLAEMHYHLQFVLFAGGVGLVVWGLSGGGRISLRDRAWHGVFRSPEFRAIAGIMALAAFLRFWHLNDTLRVLIDELHFMSGVMDLWARPNVHLMTPMTNISPFSWLYPYWQSWTVEAFGRNFTGFRAASAIIGTLNVAALYLLARVLFDRKTALLAGLLLAAFPPHIHFSRVAILQIADPLFGTLTFAFLARGWRDGRRADFVIAGACLGMTQYFYEGGRLLFPLVTAGWLVGLAVFDRRRQLPRNDAANETKGLRGLFKPSARTKHIFLFLLAAVMVAMPLYYTWEVTDDPLTGRLNASGLSTDYWAALLLSDFESGWLQAHLQHFADSLLVYVHSPEEAVYYGGYHPLVLEVLVPVFLLGVWYLIWRGGARASVVLLWILFTSLGSSVLVQATVASRYVAVLPALALVLAVGLRCVWPLIWPPESTKWRSLRTAVGILGVAVIAGGQIAYYFGSHVPTLEAQFRRVRLYRDVEDALLRSVNFPEGTQIHIVMSDMFDPNYNRDFLRFFVDGLTVETLQRPELTRDYLLSLPDDIDHAFFLEPDDQPSLSLIRGHFKLQPPAWSPYADVAEDEQFVLYYAPRMITGAAGDGEAGGRP